MLRGIITMSLVVACATEIHHLSWGGSTFGLPILDRGSTFGLDQGSTFGLPILDQGSTFGPPILDGSTFSQPILERVHYLSANTGPSSCYVAVQCI